MFAESLPPASHDPLTIIVSSIAPIVIAIATVYNHRKGKRRDASGSSVLDRIEKKIDANHTEIFAAVKELDGRVDGLEETATKNKHILVGTGPLEDNGLKSRVADLERWKNDEMETELAELRRQRGMHPTDVGTFTPRTA